MDHPRPTVLRRFLEGTTSKQENRDVVRHLLRRCGACSRTLREGDGASVLLAYEEVFRSLLGKALKQAAPA